MILKGSQAAESDIVKVTEGNARFLSFELARKPSILLGVLIVVISFLCTAQELAEIAGMKYAEQTHPGIKGYYAYMTKYKQTYLPTYRGVNMALSQPPLGSADLDTKKAYVKAKAKQSEDLSTLMGRVLECFDKIASGRVVLHTCVNTVTSTYSATGQK